MITFHNVSCSFDGGDSYAVRELSFQIADGETLVLLGSSGSGKSTALKMINRLVTPTEGSIELGGMDVMQQDVIELRRRIGYVFQGVGLFPHRSVLQNVETLPLLSGKPKNEARRTALDMLSLVDLTPDVYGERYPHELSGGQRQRVGVARALAADPEYLLMDEPFGAVDNITREQLQDSVLELKSTLGKTIIFVTHDVGEAIRLGDRIAIMHEGRLQQLGTADEMVSQPATEFVADLWKKTFRSIEALQALRTHHVASLR